MKIAFRTSGGRGEYELAGSQGTTSSTELANYAIDFQVSPNILVSGKCVLQIKNGKPRIRLNKGDDDSTHAYRWLSALLLLRKPSRVRADDEYLVARGSAPAKYQIYSIQVDVVSSASSICLLRPTIIEIHEGQSSKFISVPDRIGRIQYILENAENLPDSIQSVLSDFGKALVLPEGHKNLEELRNKVYISLANYDTSYQGSLDALPILENILFSKGIAIEEYEPKLQPIVLAEDDKRTAIEIRSDYLRSWRFVAERGYQGRKFSKSILDAYDNRCLISGVRLSKTSMNTIPGVDAAHILPWAKFDLNTVPNGLCLTKTYHWAFDSGIIRIEFDPSMNSYITIMDNLAKQAMIDARCDLSLFEPHLGVIPISRLPQQESLWPSPVFLKELNKLLIG